MSGRRVHQVRRDLLLAAARDAGRLSRAELARRTGMARMTVDHLVTGLIADGLLGEEPAVADGTRAGRPARLIILGPAAGGVVGAVISADGVRAASADLTGAILAEHHDTATGPETLAMLVAECATAIGGRIWSIVLGLGDGVDPAHATGLQQRLGRRIAVRTVAELGMLGEIGHGAAAGHTDVCYLRVGTAITGGLFLGGVPHHGATGVAGRIGHVQMDEIGPLCPCGNRGCLDTIASIPAILATLENPGLAAMAPSPTGADPDFAATETLAAARILELARHDAAAERVLADAGRMIGRAVADLAGTLNPALVVLGGPLAEAGGPIVAEVRAALHRYAQPEVAAGTEIRAGELGERAALLGALWAGLRVTPAARGVRTLARVSSSVTTASVLPSASVPPGPPPIPAGERERSVRREMIVEALRVNGPAARSDLVKLTRLPRASVAGLLDGLCRDGVVEPCRPAERRAGRPSPHFRLAAPAELLVGVAICGDGIRVIGADGTGAVRWSGFRPGIPAEGGRTATRMAAEFACELLEHHGERLGPATRFGVSVPAPVHPVTGFLSSRSVLTMFSGFSPAEEIAGVLGREVRVANNGQLAALAEARRGAARGARDVLYLSCDQFTGAGILAGRRMHSGAIGYAGEVGHLTVRELGPLCLCGRRGCLSAFLSPGYFAAISGGGPASEDRLLARAEAGDRPARRALLDAGRLIGRTVSSLVSVFNPSVVVVGGRFVEPGDFVVDGVRETLLRHCAPVVAAGLTVVPAALGNDAEPLGAVESLL
jgi:predicted NBD/HSP70 family sugar kinase